MKRMDERSRDQLANGSNQARVKRTPSSRVSNHLCRRRKRREMGYVFCSSINKKKYN